MSIPFNLNISKLTKVSRLRILVSTWKSKVADMQSKLQHFREIYKKSQNPRGKTAPPPSIPTNESEEIKALEQQLAVMHSRLLEANLSHSRTASELEPPSSPATAPAAPYASVNAERFRLEGQVSALQSQLDAVREQLVRRETELDDLRERKDAQIVEKEGERDKVYRQMEDARDEFEAKVRELKDTVAKHEQIKVSAEAAVEIAKREGLAAQEALRKQIKGVEKERDSLKKQLERANKDIQDERDKVAAAAAERDSAQQTVETVRERMREASDRARELAAAQAGRQAEAFRKLLGDVQERHKTEIAAKSKELRERQGELLDAQKKLRAAFDRERQALVEKGSKELKDIRGEMMREMEEQLAHQKELMATERRLLAKRREEEVLRYKKQIEEGSSLFESLRLEFETFKSVNASLVEKLQAEASSLRKNLSLVSVPAPKNVSAKHPTSITATAVARRQSLATKMVKLMEESARHEGRVSGLKATIKRQKVKINKLQATVDAAKLTEKRGGGFMIEARRSAVLEGKLATLEFRINSVKHDLKLKARDVEGLEKRLREKDIQITTLRKRLDSSQDEKANAETSLREARVVQAKQIAAIRETLKSQEEWEAMEKLLSEARVATRSAKEEAARRSEINQDLGKKFKEMKEQVMASEKTIKTMKQKLSKANKLVSLRDKLVSSLKEQLLVSTKQDQQSGEAKASLEAKLSVSQSTAARSKQTASNLRASLARVQAKLKLVEERAKDSGELESRISQLRSDVKRARSLHDHARRRVETLTQDSQKMTARIQDLEKAVIASKVEARRMREEAEVCKKDLSKAFPKDIAGDILGTVRGLSKSLVRSIFAVSDGLEQ
eukprot:510954-Amorphochlora_amoeboformis.AAC.1